MCCHVVLEEGMEIPAKIWSLSFIVPILGGGKKKQELCKNIVQGLTGQIYKSVKPFFAYVYEA